jgi:hypothetical protein
MLEFTSSFSRPLSRAWRPGAISLPKLEGLGCDSPVLDRLESSQMASLDLMPKFRSHLVCLPSAEAPAASTTTDEQFLAMRRQVDQVLQTQHAVTGYLFSGMAG